MKMSSCSQPDRVMVRSFADDGDVSDQGQIGPQKRSGRMSVHSSRARSGSQPTMPQITSSMVRSPSHMTR